MFNKKQREIEKEEFLKTRSELQQRILEDNVESLKNMKKLKKLPANKKIDVILDLLLMNSGSPMINYLAKQHCK